MPAIRRISARDARRVLLRRQALADAPDRSSAAAVARLVERLGYVQVDSINRLERAHHLILGVRLEGYSGEHLARSIEVDRALFEHWTHDASVLPIAWLSHWKRRFERHRRKPPTSTWWRERFGGKPDPVLRRVLARVERDGPLRSRDFVAGKERREDGGEGWWSWHPEKAALEHLWRCGLLAVARRDGFEKVYDLFERVHPHAAHVAASDEESHLAWACRTALERLGIATTREIAGFLNASSAAEVEGWCRAAATRGDIECLEVERADGGTPVRSVAVPEWQRDAGPLPSRMRVLSPFDPILRDRARTERLFGFVYRFEAFTPAAKRRYGYYVCPLLDGDRLIGRIDPTFDRRRRELVVPEPWWEPESKSTRSGSGSGRIRRLRTALADVARLVGAQAVVGGRSG